MSAWAPTCMSAEEYADWRAAALWGYATAGVYIPVVCVDCPAAFRAEARAVGACNAPKSRAELRAEVLALRAEGLSWAQVDLRMGRSTGKPGMWSLNLFRDRSKPKKRRAA